MSFKQRVRDLIIDHEGITCITHRQRKVPCKHVGKCIGMVDKECCGGKLKPHLIYACDNPEFSTPKLGIRDCTRCMGYEARDENV